jgi:hypothetical protein
MFEILREAFLTIIIITFLSKWNAFDAILIGIFITISTTAVI